MTQIIPAIDIIQGECVRLTQGDYAQKKSYYKDPLEVAKMFEEIGIKRLHVVDLDGAKAAHPQNLKILERLSTHTQLHIQFGGGIKSIQALQEVWSAGARWAILGSIAVKNYPEVASWIQTLGKDRLILGADVKQGWVATDGWLESSQMSIDEIVSQYATVGLHEVICTEISKDGMLQGPAIELYKEMTAKHPDLILTASGGVSRMQDIIDLEAASIPQVIVGKAIYEQRITLKEIAQWLQRG